MNRILTFFVVVALALASVGCSSDNGTGYNPQGAEQEIAAGNAALGAGDIDAAYQHFSAALAMDPGNSDARFGVAVTGVYLVQNDPEVQGVYDYINGATSPAPVRAGEPPSRSEALTRSLGFPGGVSNGDLGPSRMGAGVLRMLRAAADDPPAVSDVQRIIKTVVLPRLQHAEGHLNFIEQGTEFTFLLPPAATGLADTIEIDLADVYMLDTVINGVQGWLGMLVAYDFDVPDSDFEHVNAESLLAAGTDWATLHQDGEVQLAAAKMNLGLVNTKFIQAVTYLQAETDDQVDDVLPQEWLDTTEYTEVSDGLLQLATSLAGPVSTDVDDYLGNPFTLQIDIGRFFTSAIADLKTVLPALTFTAGEPDITLPITFTDPQINGIFPDMTNARWQELTGLVSPTVARR
jgi:hypothetical protein